jgi:catechol 2,3-dioxygenase-like lactoylglutathione lyase family enzyme
MDLAQLHISVSDLERSVAFYRDVLGLDFLFEVPDQKMAFLQAGPVRIYLGEAESPEQESHPLAYYRVDGVQKEYQRLLAAGASKGTPPHRVHSDETQELWMAAVADPDGHSVVLMEERPIV